MIEPKPVEELCADLIRCDTSNGGPGRAKGEWQAADLVAERLTEAGLTPTLLERSPGRSNVVARVPGADRTLPPILVHMHLDVVPADESEWTVPPFGGEIRDGYVWGRGAVDMKDMCATVLTTMQRWAAEGRGPRRDIVLAFVADEEATSYYGAQWLVDAHRELFDGCVAAFSESGGFTVPMRAEDGSPVRLYPVGTAERGTAHLRLTANGRAGHGSRRNDDNAVVTLANAITRLAAHQWPVHLTPAVVEFLRQTCAALGVPCDLSDVDATVARLGPAAKLVENTVRNSTIPTVLSAGNKVNVIPAIAQAQVDGRVLPGTEVELLAEVDRILGPSVRRELIANRPAVESSVVSPWFDAMAAALRAEDPDALVVPYCLGGGTDAKAFSQLGMECFGFAPLLLPDGFDYRSMAHGVDERVPVEGLRFGVEVLDRFLSEC